MWSSGRSEAALEAALPVPIVVRPLRSAKRLRLRFDENAGILKLTCPARTGRRVALTWALGQREWIEAQVRRTPPPLPLTNGAIIPIEGVDVRLEWAENSPRTPLLSDGVLRCGGPRSSFERRITAFLRRRALDTMAGEARAYAAAAGARVNAVSVGDAGSRWGSCSSQGRIRLSWRLILAPASVRRYVVAHEVAHLVHLNHGAEFKALEARLFGTGVAEAKAILRRVGPRIRRVGRRL